ncbi:hypothetical protein WJX72_003459 [[Myrmecia] bisecta]|uniref:Dolichol phosphate-mannose biosynthesis regulatory protein n=1 Tax=[Myrmecia] bisecta TaxID=41462 RepID=A0AAW1Q1U9_9CHLO
MPVDERVTGAFILVLGALAFSYYTVWVLLTPFVEEGHVLLKAFPRRYYAIAIPTAAGVILFAVTLGFIGVALVASELSKLQRQRQRRCD